MSLTTLWTTLTSTHTTITSTILTHALSEKQSWKHLEKTWEQVLILTLVPANPSSITSEEYHNFITRYGPWKELYTKTTAVCKPQTPSSPITYISWFHPSTTTSIIHHLNTTQFQLTIKWQKHIVENDQQDGYHVTDPAFAGYYFAHLADLVNHYLNNSESHVIEWNQLLKQNTKHEQKHDESDDEDDGEHTSRIRFNADVEPINVRFREGSTTSIASSTDGEHESGPTFHRPNTTLDLKNLKKKKVKPHQGVAFHAGVYGAKTMRFRMDDEGRLIDENGNVHTRTTVESTSTQQQHDDEPELEGISIHDASDPESIMELLIEVTQELNKVQGTVATLQARVQQLTQALKKHQATTTQK